MKEIRLESPRSDICNACEVLEATIKTVCHPKQHQLKQEKLRVRKGYAFFMQLRNVRKIAEEDSKKYLAICFDYQKSLPLPQTDAGEENYLRQLWIHNLGIHNLGTDLQWFFMQSILLLKDQMKLSVPSSGTSKIT